MSNLPPHSNSAASDMTNMQLHFHHAILDHIPSHVVVFDLLDHGDVRLAYMNVAARQDTGLALDNIGKSIDTYLQPAEAEAVRHAIQECLSRKALVTLEQQIAMPSGAMWLFTKFIPMQQADGRITQILLLVENITARKQQELTEQQRQAELIEQQAMTLAEMSTPILAISESTVVMPLVGAIDTRRIDQIMDTLLSGVAGSRATTVILDITGVPVVDTQVANALIQAAQAVKLLGADAVLTGMRPEVAQTLVQLGVSLRDIITRGTLQDGIAFALHR